MNEKVLRAYKNENDEVVISYTPYYEEFYEDLMGETSYRISLYDMAGYSRSLCRGSKEGEYQYLRSKSEPACQIIAVMNPDKIRVEADGSTVGIVPAGSWLQVVGEDGPYYQEYTEEELKEKFDSITEEEYYGKK
jgi:hypothetical protein